MLTSASPCRSAFAALGFAALFTTAACSSTSTGQAASPDPNAEISEDPSEETPAPPDSGATGRSPGQPCKRKSDCQGGDRAACLTKLPNGYCVITGCTIGRDDCPAGSFCIDVGSGATACVEGKCKRDSDCSRWREGYKCDSDQSCWYSAPACTPEADGALCQRLSYQCGSVTTPDNCGTQRTVNCGACSSGSCQNNVCSSCVPDSDATLCQALGKTCGQHVATDACGATRTVNCGGPCPAPTCTDGIKNQGESDVDCGGPCARCTVGKSCNAATDCIATECNSNARCDNGTCAQTPSADGTFCANSSSIQLRECRAGACRGAVAICEWTGTNLDYRRWDATRGGYDHEYVSDCGCNGGGTSFFRKASGTGFITSESCFACARKNDRDYCWK